MGLLALTLGSCLSPGSNSEPTSPVQTPVQGPLPLGRAINSLADDLLLQMEPGTELAIGDILMGSRKNRLTAMMEDQITIALTRRGQGMIYVLERKALEAVLAETQYSITSISANPGNLAAMGRFIPAGVLGIGSVEVFDSFVRLNLRCFSTANGFLKAASSIEIIHDTDLDSYIPLL